MNLFDPSGRGARRLPAGFTLIEVMVTVGLIAVLAALAMPSFTQLINTNRLAGLSNDINVMLQSARLEAVRRGTRVVICPSTNGTGCTTGTRWQRWLSFVDVNANNTVDAGDEILRSESVYAPLELRVDTGISTGSRIVFRSNGFIYNSGGTALLAGVLSACLPTDNPPQNSREVRIAAGTRISVAPVTNAECNAP